MDPISQRWHVPEDAGLRWRSWGDEHVVFHAASGDTHLLNPSAAEVLRRMQSESATVEDIAQVLGPGSRASATDLLQRLSELGLIVRLHETI